MEESRSAERCLVHDHRISELLYKRFFTLDGSIRYLGVLLGAVAIPLLVSDVVHHVDDAVGIGEVDKRISNIACGVEVDAQIEEVILSKTVLVEERFQCKLVKG